MRRHSANSNWPTSIGFNQTHSVIFAAVSPTPHLPVHASGRQNAAELQSVWDRYRNWMYAYGLNVVGRNLDILQEWERGMGKYFYSVPLYKIRDHADELSKSISRTEIDPG